MYGSAVRCKRTSSRWRRVVLHQCGRPLIGAYAPGHHGYQRACDPTSGLASRRPFGCSVFACVGKTAPPSPLILSQTSAGTPDAQAHSPELNGLEDAVRQYSDMPLRLAFRAIFSANPLLSERNKFSNLLVPFCSPFRKTLQGVRNGRECLRPIDTLRRGALMLCDWRATILHTTAIAVF